MHGRYEVEDLLKLRASPLVAKPPGLPPKEEWMGPLDPRPRVPSTRGKPDDSFTQTEGFQKRPTPLDSSRRSATDPHLGPPRYSFTSATGRTRNGTHERTKTNDDSDTKTTDRRSGNYSGPNGRFDGRSDYGGDAPDKPHRRNNDDDQDGRPRREFDRSRWSNRHGGDDRDDESHPRNTRDSYSRSKLDQPWTRKEKPSDLDDEARTDCPAWRRGARDRNVDRPEAEPEWADVEEAPTSNKAHTQEDFAAWLAKMKGKPVVDEKIAQEAAEKELAAPTSERPPPRAVSDSSASVDKFFAKFEEKKTADANHANARPVKSRFASIFGAKDEAKPTSPTTETAVVYPAPAAPLPPPSLPPTAELEQPAPTADSEKKANDAAFAKLLEMLNKNQTMSSPNPNPGQSQSSRSPPHMAELASTKSPDIVLASAVQPQSTRTPVLSHTPNLSLDRIIESRSPAHHVQPEHPGQARAGPQDLLDLLRRSTINEKQPAQQQPTGYLPQQELRMQPLPPGLARIPTHETERQHAPLINTRRDAPRSIFDDPALQGYRAEPEYPPRLAQPSDHGGLTNLFASINKQNYMTNAQPERPPPPPQAMPNLPPGLQRPPGLDPGPRPPPGWPMNAQPHPPMQNYLPPNQHPMYNHNGFPPQPQPQQPTRQQPPPPRKPVGDLPPNYAHVPPGFGLPPHYPSPTSPDAAMYAMRGAYGMTERERMDRERQQNAFAAMYGNGSRTGNGGVPLPPGFR